MSANPPQTDVLSEPASHEMSMTSVRLIITVLALCGTLVSLQQTLVLPLLPEFPRILNTTTENASWLVTVTLLTSAVGTPIVSRLADMYGKKLMMIFCLVCVILGSLMALVSSTLPWVIAGRGLAGIGTCLVPVGISIMRDQLPAEKVGQGVALMSATLGIGGAIGIPLAGVISEQWDWHALFLVSGAFAVVMLILVVMIVPESQVRTKGRFDYIGAVLLSAVLTSFLLAISKAGAWGWDDARTITLILVAGAILAAWVPWELHSGQPLVDIRTATRRTVLLTNSASVLIGFAMFSNFLTSAQQVQMPIATGYGFNLSVIETGLVMLPAGLAMVAMSPVAAGLISRFGARSVLMAGPLIMAVGFILRTFLTGSVAEVMIAAGITSIGTAMSFAAMPALIIRSVPITETASANGLNTLLRALGTATASAVVAAVFSSLTVTVGQAVVPSFTAYQVVFYAGAAAAIGGAGIAAFIRRPVAAAAGQVSDKPGDRHQMKAEGTHSELIVTGRIVDDNEQPMKQAVVTVLHPDGRHLDWSRTDASGRYAVALPQAGTYLMIASADGWGPMSGLVELGDGDFDVIKMNRRLRLMGWVTDDGAPFGDVLVSLIQHSGDYAATTTADTDGYYDIGLPPPGRYVLTVVHAASGRTKSRAVHVGSMSATVDIDLTTGVPAQLRKMARS